MKYLKQEKHVLEGVAFFVFSLFIIIHSILEHNYLACELFISPYLFPLISAFALMILSVLLILENLKVKHKDNRAETKNFKKLFMALLLVFIYYFLMQYLGFVIATVIFLANLFYLLGERRVMLIILLSLATSLISYYIFAELLHVLLPKFFVFLG